MAKTNIMTCYRAKSATRLLSFAVGIFLILCDSPSAFASSWSPTVLVNTEAFQTIDHSDADSNLYIQFGQTINKNITYERVEERFSFDDDIYVTGGVESTGTMTGAKLYVESGGNPLLVTRTSSERVGIGTNNPDRKLEVVGTISGSTLRATTSLRSSGSLVWEGSASGASLWISRFEGAGLTDCDNATTSKLLWDATEQQFRCGTDQTGGGGGVMTLLGETTLGSDNGTISVSLSSSTEYIHCSLSTKGQSSTSSIKYLRTNGDSGSASYGWNGYSIIATAIADWQDASDSEIQLTGTTGGDDPFTTDVTIV